MFSLQLCYIIISQENSFDQLIYCPKLTSSLPDSPPSPGLCYFPVQHSSLANSLTNICLTGIPDFNLVCPHIYICNIYIYCTFDHIFSYFKPFTIFPDTERKIPTPSGGPLDLCLPSNSCLASPLSVTTFHHTKFLLIL